MSTLRVVCLLNAGSERLHSLLWAVKRHYNAAFCHVTLDNCYYRMPIVVTTGRENAGSRAAAVPIDIHCSVWLSWWCCCQDTRHVVQPHIGQFDIPHQFVFNFYQADFSALTLLGWRQNEHLALPHLIQTGFTFLVLCCPDCPGKEAVRWVS